MTNTSGRDDLAGLLARLREISYNLSYAKPQGWLTFCNTADKAHAAIIKLEHELKTQDDFWNERCADVSMLAHKWMVAHDCLKEGKPYSYPEPADLPNAIIKLEQENARLRGVGNEILTIADEYKRQEESGYVYSPGGLEHMGDVWRKISRWAEALRADGKEG